MSKEVHKNLQLDTQPRFVVDIRPRALHDETGARRFWETLGAPYDPFEHGCTESEPKFVEYCVPPAGIVDKLKEAYGNQLNCFCPAVVLISGKPGSGKTAASAYLERHLDNTTFSKPTLNHRVRYLTADNNGHLNLARAASALGEFPEVTIVDMPSDAPPGDLKILLNEIRPGLEQGRRSLAVFGSPDLINEVAGLFEVESGDDEPSLVVVGRLIWTPAELEELVNSRISIAHRVGKAGILSLGSFESQVDFSLSEIFENIGLSTPREAIGFMRMAINRSVEMAKGEVEGLRVLDGVEQVQFLYRVLEGYAR